MTIGARIIFLESIYEPACGEHPEFILCKKNGTGSITGPENERGYLVKWDEWPHADFRCLQSEFRYE